MMYEKVLNALQRKYSVIDVINLTEFDQQRVKKLFARVGECQKDVFNDNERIVIVADGTLNTTFRGFPADILVELQQHIHYYNIPHYFVIVVSNNPNIEKHLDYLQKKYYPQETAPISAIKV